MLVAGLDLSLRSTGLARIGAGPVETGRIRTRRTGMRRLQKIEDECAQWCAGADAVFIEGPAFGAYDSNRQLAGLWWIIRYRLWEEGIPVGVVPPATLKLYVAGKGNAGKRAMVDAVNGPGFPDVIVESDDEADAAGLAYLGLRAVGAPRDMATRVRDEIAGRGLVAPRMDM